MRVRRSQSVGQGEWMRKTSLFGLPRRTIFFSIGREGRKPSILVVRITSEVLLPLRRAPIGGGGTNRQEGKKGRKEGRKESNLKSDAAHANGDVTMKETKHQQMNLNKKKDGRLRGSEAQGEVRASR